MEEHYKLLISVMKVLLLRCKLLCYYKDERHGKRSHGSLHFLIMTQIQLLCNLIHYRATGNCSNRVTALVIKTCSLWNKKMLLFRALISQETDDGSIQQETVILLRTNYDGSPDHIVMLDSELDVKNEALFVLLLSAHGTGWELATAVSVEDIQNCSAKSSNSSHNFCFVWKEVRKVDTSSVFESIQLWRPNRPLITLQEDKLYDAFSPKSSTMLGC